MRKGKRGELLWEAKQSIDPESGNRAGFGGYRHASSSASGAADIQCPRVSPDGQWIAFKAQTRDETTELAVVPVEGHKQGFRVLLPAAITDMTDLLHNPCWSPDGWQILAAVTTKANPRGSSTSWTLRVGRGAKLLPGLEQDRWYNDMAWSPDGKHIVVSTRQTAIESLQRCRFSHRCLLRLRSCGTSGSVPSHCGQKMGGVLRSVRN